LLLTVGSSLLAVLAIGLRLGEVVPCTREGEGTRSGKGLGLRGTGGMGLNAFHDWDRTVDANPDNFE
jgi:hypothetical protein